MVDGKFIVTGSSYKVVNRALIQLVAVVVVAITVDGQLTVRVHCDSTVTIVSLSGSPGTVVHQASVQNIIPAMDI